MADLIEVKVPDIGDFKDVPIIEVLVRPGDRVKAEDPLITLESDKASMDVPSPLDGVVKELKVKVGDKVSEGSLILIAEADRHRPASRRRRKSRKEGSHRRRRAGRRLWRGVGNLMARSKCACPT